MQKIGDRYQDMSDDVVHVCPSLRDFPFQPTSIVCLQSNPMTREFDEPVWISCFSA